MTFRALILYTLLHLLHKSKLPFGLRLSSQLQLFLINICYILCNGVIRPPSVPASGPGAEASVPELSVWPRLSTVPGHALLRLQRHALQQDGLLRLVGSLRLVSGREPVTQSPHRSAVWPLPLALLLIGRRRAQRRQCKVTIDTFNIKRKILIIN